MPSPQTNNLPAWAAEWDQASTGKPVSSTAALPAWAAQWDASTKATNAKPPNPAMGSATLPFGPWDTHIPIPGWLNRGLAGAGEYPVNLARGLEERLGKISPQQIAEDQKLDAPLNATTAGNVGNFLGGVATTAPAMLIPGINTVAGGAALGGTLGFLTPTTNDKQTAINTVLGGLTGGAGTWGGNKVSGLATRALARRAASALAGQQENAERDAVLAAGRKEGYVVPPTAIRPNAVNTTLESVSGKAATRQGAETINQGVTDALAARDLGLSRTPSQSVLRGVRKAQGTAYGNVEKALPSFKSDQEYSDAVDALLGKQADLDSAYPGSQSNTPKAVQDLVTSLKVDAHNGPAAVKYSRTLRALSKQSFQRYFRTQDPADLELANAQKGGASALEGLIERELGRQNMPELAANWRNARTAIAKSYQIGAALKNGHVNALKFAAQLDKNNGGPLSGGMDLAARFAQQFPEVSRVPKSGVGVSKLGVLTPLTEALLGGGSAAYLHSPELALGTGAVTAATAAAPYAARKAILSGLGQRMLASPNYSPGMLGTGLLQAMRAMKYPALQRAAIPAALQLSGPQ